MKTGDAYTSALDVRCWMFACKSFATNPYPPGRVEYTNPAGVSHGGPYPAVGLFPGVPWPAPGSCPRPYPVSAVFAEVVYPGAGFVAVVAVVVVEAVSAGPGVVSVAVVAVTDLDPVFVVGFAVVSAVAGSGPFFSAGAFQFLAGDRRLDAGWVGK